MTPWLIGGLTLGLDQLTKFLIVTSFSPGQSLPLLGPLVHLTYVQNTGAAFGLFKGQQLAFIGLSIAVVLWIGREFLTKTPMPADMMWGCAFVLGGALGNLIDRVRLGYVIDFIDLRVWPVFNMADSAISIGVALLILHAARTSRR